jgi:N-acetylmuramate 1-kinase
MRAMERYIHKELRLPLPDLAATVALAGALAKLVVIGDVLRLVGDLGAGKTTLTQHLLAALGHVGEVPSPTYTLVQTYDDTRVPVLHVDCYRTKHPDELLALGVPEYRAHGLIVAEWPDMGGPLLAAAQPDWVGYHINSIENYGVLTIELRMVGDGREAILRGSPAWQRRLSLLPSLGVVVPGVVLARPQTAEGRVAFLDGVLGAGTYTLAHRDGDWSGRSYGRVTLADGSTRMLMDAPPPTENAGSYVTVAEQYRAMGLRTARIDAQDLEEGYLLTEDFGDTTLWHALQDGRDHRDWYGVAGEMLVRQCENFAEAGAPIGARLYGPRDWWLEAVRWVNWYLPLARGGRGATLEEVATWQRLWAEAYPLVAAMPNGLMMWDCQSPNLMLLGQEPTLANLGVIDHQDARVAPMAQDAALLLRNIRTAQDDAREAWVLDRLAKDLAVSRSDLQLALEVASLHHSCRILGGLVRLAVRDNRPAPAQAFLARTWEVAKQSFACPQLAELAALMAPTEGPGLEALWQKFPTA